MSAPLSPERLAPGAYARMRAALGVVHAAMKQHGALPVAMVQGLEAAGLLQSPESAAEAAGLRARVTELEQQLAVRTFYLAESEDAEGGPTLHTTHVAAIAWCDEVEPGEWFEDDGVWVQCDTDPDTDRPTTRGAGTVTPLTAQGDGIVAEAERIRQELVQAAAKVPVLTEVRDSQRDEICRLQTEQGEVMQALGCDRHDEWDDVVHRARQLAGGTAVAR